MRGTQYRLQMTNMRSIRLQHHGQLAAAKSKVTAIL